jgi:hypothetical protein
MRNRTGGQCRLEEAFRQELFRLINQYLSFPKDATLGALSWLLGVAGVFYCASLLYPSSS